MASKDRNRLPKSTSSILCSRCLKRILTLGDSDEPRKHKCSHGLGCEENSCARCGGSEFPAFDDPRYARYMVDWGAPGARSLSDAEAGRLARKLFPALTSQDHERLMLIRRGTLHALEDQLRRLNSGKRSAEYIVLVFKIEEANQKARAHYYGSLSKEWVIPWREARRNAPAGPAAVAADKLGRRDAV